MISPIVIGIGYKKYSGKDTVANRLVDHHGFLKISFADSLKAACSIIFGLTEDQLYGHTKEIIDPKWGKTPREILQLVGTNALRNHFDENLWVQSAFLKIQKQCEATPDIQLKFVIPDVRFPNEGQQIKLLPNSYLWRVDRELPTNQFSTHESETAMDSFSDWDSILKNDSTISNLYKKADELIVSLSKKDVHEFNRRKTKSV